MVHGDDQGLMLPPRLAPIQVVLVPIWKNEAERTQVLEVAHRVQDMLEGVRFRLDDREGYTPGWKFNDWEMRGVPLRLELGPRDAAANQVTLVRRDLQGVREAVPLEGLRERVLSLLDEVQKSLFERALRFREEHTHYPDDYGGLVEAVEDGFAWAWWCGSAECETKVKEETKATIRNIPLNQPGGSGRCVVCGALAREQAVFARAY
jgi:prolyl-tRNA synthetase